MKKLKLGLAAFITALIFSSCGGEDAGILAASGAQEYDPGKGKVETDITVTFKNGWEDIAEGQIKDDEYTEGGPYKKLSPEKVKAVVDKTELETYNAAYTEWERVAGLWDDYNTKLEAYQNNPSGESPPPPKKI